MISEEQKARLIQEQSDLHERSVKLIAFIDDRNPAYDALDDEMKFLLEVQYSAMAQYEHVLLRRMSLLGMVPSEPSA